MNNKCLHLNKKCYFKTVPAIVVGEKKGDPRYLVIAWSTDHKWDGFNTPGWPPNKEDLDEYEFVTDDQYLDTDKYWWWLVDIDEIEFEGLERMVKELKAELE